MADTLLESDHERRELLCYAVGHLAALLAKERGDIDPYESAQGYIKDAEGWARELVKKYRED